MERRLARNSYREFCAEWSADFAPRIKRKPSTWASEVRVIAAGTSPLSHGHDIRYDHAIMPHCVEPMDAADDPGVRKIVLWWPIRDGKTLGVCANIIGRTVTDCPDNIYSVHPTEDNADMFSTGDVEPMIEACLSSYFVAKKSRDTGRTIELKKFKGGWLRIFSANAIAKFHGTSVGVLLLHELDKLDPEAIWKAFGRTTGFSDAIIVMESTGTLTAEITPEGKKVYRSNIEEAYDQGDKRKWFCACRNCGYLQTLKYEQIKYLPGKMEAAVYVCEACSHHHSNREWHKLAALGKWYPTAGLTEAQERDIARHWRHARAIDPSVRSYWRNGFNSLLPHSKGYRSKLHQFVAEGEAAQTSQPAKMVWTQEVKAELWNPEATGEPPPAWKPIFDGREDYATAERIIVPQPAIVLTCMTDLHSNRLETEWRAWASNAESWGLAHVVLDGDTNDMDVWERWVKEMARTFTREDKATLGLSLAFVDGGWRPDPISAILHRLATQPAPGVSGKIRATKGVGQHGMPIMSRKWQTIKGNLKGYHIGIWGAKRWIYDRLAWHGAADKPDAEFIHFGQNYSEEAIRQTVSETAIKEFDRGMEIEKFINPAGNRNELLDLLVGNLAAFRRHDWNFDVMEAELLAKIPGDKPKPAQRVAQTPVRKSSYFDWRR